VEVDATWGHHSHLYAGPEETTDELLGVPLLRA
jgi:hypothetical protein